jgi:hypothetical protein
MAVERALGVSMDAQPERLWPPESSMLADALLGFFKKQGHSLETCELRSVTASMAAMNAKKFARPQFGSAGAQ